MLTTARETWMYWREPNKGPQRWWRSWSTPPMRTDWDSWDCSTRRCWTSPLAWGNLLNEDFSMKAIMLSMGGQRDYGVHPWWYSKAFGHGPQQTPLRWLCLSTVLDQKTSRSPFHSQPFCDSAMPLMFALCYAVVLIDCLLTEELFSLLVLGRVYRFIQFQLSKVLFMWRDFKE